MSQQPNARVIAFYLPQFHPIPENDRWWGKGFTEWTNVGRAQKLFPGHYQPRVPADLGYYDLRVPEVREAQAAMARESGVEAFCYWHYWFGNGRRLLERPFQEVVASGKPDFPFCLAWANESWSGIWHGAPKKILMEQCYPGKADYRDHFYALLSAFQDPRYVRVNGKLLFYIYRAEDLPDAQEFADCWRELAHKESLGDFYFIATANLSDVRPPYWNPLAHGFDAFNFRCVEGVRYRTKFGHAVNKLKRMCGIYANYARYADSIPLFQMRDTVDFPHYPTIITGWDNTPRSNRRGFVLTDFTPEKFRIHLQDVFTIASAFPAERRLVFLKSWNEWAEGNYIEPDLRYGRAFLDVLREELHNRATISSTGSTTNGDMAAAA